MHDFPPAAAYVVMANLEGGQGVESLSYWTFTDVFEELGAGDTCWHGGFGMISFQGLPKPTYHAYRFLNQLGREKLAQSDGHVVTRHADGRIATLLYHYPSGFAKTPPICSTPDQARDVLHQGARKT